MTGRKQLCNNVVLLTENAPQLNSMSIGFWFATGSRFENSQNRGIAHFCEHMIFKGTGTRSARDISLAFDSIGGYVNAWTEREAVCLYCTIPSGNENLEKALELLVDMTENSVFPSDEMEKEREVIKNEILSCQDDPEERSLDVLAWNIWKDTSLGQTISGSIDDVESLTRENLLEWYRNFFVHGELRVCAGGNFDQELLEKLLGNLSSKRKCVSRHFENREVFTASRSFEKSLFSQQQVFEAFNWTGGLTCRDYFSMCVFNSCTGGSLSSRLFDVLREQNGFCYNVESWWSFYEGTVSWICSTSCEWKRTGEVLETLRKEFLKIQEKGLSETEIEIAKKHLVGEELITSCDCEILMKRLDRWEGFGFDLMDTDEIIEQIRKVTVQDVMDVVKKLFAGREFVLVYGPKLNRKIRKEFL